jgi:hypothetical protein
MKELFFCPGCGSVIDMSAAVCTGCGTDISVLTGVKRKATVPGKNLTKMEENDENEEPDEDEIIEEEEEQDEKDLSREIKTSVKKKGSAFGRWFKRLLFLGICSLGVWAYQQAGGIKGLKNLLSTEDGNPVTEQKGGGQPLGETSRAKEHTTTVQPERDKLTDLVNSPEEVTKPLTIRDFAGEWNPGNLNPGSTDRIAKEHVIIRQDGSGNMVIYFKGFEKTPALLNYKWSAITGRKVECVMSYKDDPENRGAVSIELSADNNFLLYSTLDKNTMRVMTTHKLQRVQ